MGKISYLKKLIPIFFFYLILLSQHSSKSVEIRDELEILEETQIKSKINFSEKEKTLSSELPEVKAFGFFDSQECLLDKSKSQEMLKNLNMTTPLDENLRFILGSCNPVLLIPGIYATRLILTIDCKKFSQKTENLINMRMYCGKGICKGDKDNEEHVIWPAMFDSPFQLWSNPESLYSSCFGYFFNFYKPTDCPTEKKKEGFLGKVIEESICLVDESVKVTFYGATEETVKNSQCGVKSVKDVVSAGTTYFPESWLNFGSTHSFQAMHERFSEMGYRPGFSIGAVPFDFRRFVGTNHLFKALFKSQVERLYANTGKPVVIIAHSYGALNTLNELAYGDKTLTDKIKKFVAIGPPFGGASKDIELFLIGTKEFSKNFNFMGYGMEVGLNTFGQKLFTSTLTSGYELRPHPILANLFNDNKYNDFRLAIQERMDLERECKNRDCSSDYIKEHSVMFSKVFAGLPDLSEKECQVTELLKGDKFKNFKSKYDSNPELNFPNILPCRYSIYNMAQCPILRYRRNETEDASILESHCDGTDTDLSSKDLNYYNHDCGKNKNCIDNFFKDNFNYPFSDPRLSEIIQKFNTTYSKDFPGVDLNVTKYFDSREEVKGKVSKMIDFYEEISPLRTMEIPKVDTILIYGNFLPTVTAYLYDEKKNQDEFKKEDKLYRGGDGTVPAWASLIPGLKWLYEKTTQKLSQNIQIVEYCSLLGLKGSKYAFTNETKYNPFLALPCDCMDNDFYQFNKVVDGPCTHPVMVSDKNIIKFLENYMTDESSTEINEARKSALQSYNQTIDYENECNLKLKEFSDLGL
jgi:hypothetical protein